VGVQTSALRAPCSKLAARYAGGGGMNIFESQLLLLVPAMFFGMLGSYKLGRRLGRAHWDRNPRGAEAGAGAVDAAVFALLGLLVAFTFSGAAERFDQRRQLIVEESNAIGTAYLRLDLLPAEAQPLLRAKFRRYLDTRIAYYRSLTKPDEARRLKLESEELQRGIWTQAAHAAWLVPSPAPMTLVIGALNEMIDITATRAMSLLTHPPEAIYALLVFLALLCGLLAGFGTAPCEQPSRFHMYGFPAIVTLTLYLTIDLEFPRYGLIRVDAADQVLIDVRRSMQ
jgi:hypothetical protein